MLNVSTLSQRDKKIRNTILKKSNINTTYFSKTLERLEYRGPNKETFEKKANGQRKLGWPQQREFRQEIPQAQQVGWLKRFY